MINTDAPVQVTLLPCPFCGGEANADGHIKFSQPLNDTWWPGEVPITEAFYVNCVRCGAVSRSGIVGGYQSRDEAITAWNTRAASNGEGADVDTLAEILAPFAFKSWRGMVDHCLKSGDDQQTSEFYATETYGGQMEQARVDAKKAIDYFAALAASSHPASAGDALADELRRAFPVGDKIGVRLSEDMFSRILRALSATPAQEGESDV